MGKDRTNRIEKQLKVTNQPQGNSYVPGFRLAGKYMEQLGFNNGDTVDVIAENDVIIIRKCNEGQTLSDMMKKNPLLLTLIRTFSLVPDETV